MDDLVGWDFTTGTITLQLLHGTATLSQVIGDGTIGTQTGVALSKVSPYEKCQHTNPSNGLHSNMEFRWVQILSQAL